MNKQGEVPKTTEKGPDSVSPSLESDLEITVTSKKTKRQITFKRSFGKNLEEAVGAYGAEVVFSIFVAMATIKAQAAARGALDSSDRSPADAIAAGESYTPGIIHRGGGRTKKDPVDILADRVRSGKMSLQEITAMLKEQITKTSSAS